MKSKNKTLLWQVRRPEQEHFSYVFGTMHVRDNAAFQRLDLVLDKLQDCDAFATEYDLDEGEAQIPKELVYLPEGQSLTDFIPTKKYKKLRNAILKSFQIDLNLFKKLRPIFINNFLNEQLLSTDRKQPLDGYLWNYAKSADKILLGIETWQEQVATLEHITLEYQIKGLLEIGKNPKKIRRAIQKSVKDYVAGDFQKLYQAARKGSGDKRKILLYSRNEIMARRIAHFSDQHSIFAAIGAGHLGGAKGVLRLLKKQGFSVQPIHE